MSTRIVLAHTPAPDQRPAVHSIPCEGVVYPEVRYDGHKVGDLVIDPTSQTVSVGAKHIFRAGSGMSVTHHLHPNKLNIDYRGKRVTLFVPDNGLCTTISGQLTLFSYSPPGHCLLAPIAVGAVSATFSAYCAVSDSIVAVRHVRAQDLRHAAADTVIDRSHSILKTVPECKRNNILRPNHAFWHKNNFYAITPLLSPLHHIMPPTTHTAESTASSEGGENATTSSMSENQTIDYSLVRNIIHDLLQALAHLHSHGVVHGHVTRQHVLLTEDNRVRLTGFGRSITTSSNINGGTEANSMSDDRGGTKSSALANPLLDTSAPLCRGPYAKTIGRDAVPPGGLSKKKRPTAAADVWGAGVVLYSLLHDDDLSVLHSRDVRSKMLQMAQSNTADWTSLLDLKDDVPADLVSLVRALLQPIAKKRLSARAALEHRALTKLHTRVEEQGLSVCASDEEDAWVGEDEETEFSSCRLQTRARFQSMVCRVVNVVGLVSALQTPAIPQHVS